MKILVFSDSHQNPKNMLAGLSEHRGTVDLVIHLGDGLGDLNLARDLLNGVAVATVLGNGEEYFHKRLWGDVPDEFTISPDGVKIFCCHGHKYRVKLGLGDAVARAEEKGADLLLYGHTHNPYDGWETAPGGKAIHVFNPGSIGMAYPESYGIIEISGGVALTSHRFFH